MRLNDFLHYTGCEKPLIAVRGNIFETPADHIAFAVHYPDGQGCYDNSAGGFSSLVYDYGWTELKTTEFEPGVPQSKKIGGKTFHALPVHSNEHDGWSKAPRLIEQSLNKLEVSSEEVIACVLMGGGSSGETYKASVKNLQGLVRSHKTTVLYVYEDVVFQLLVGTGLVAVPHQAVRLMEPMFVSTDNSQQFNEFKEAFTLPLALN